MKNYPTISIVIPTFNEEANIGACLRRIYQQNYPKNKLTVWVVDNYSTDGTVKIAQKYPVKLLYNKLKDAQVSKMLAFKKSTGDFFCYIDADYKILGNNWLKKMVYPLLDDSAIVGSFTRYLVDRSDNALNRCLSYDLLQRDPIFKFFSTELEKTFVEKRKGYFVCEFQTGRIPPIGICLYRRKYVLKTEIPNRNKLMELDNLEILAKAGYNKFAYVPRAGYYHYHVKNIFHLIQKRVRNIERNYFYDYKVRKYTWVNFSNPKDWLKIIFWVIYANLFLPSLIVSLFKVVEKRDWACLWEPFINLIITNLTICQFIVLFSKIKKPSRVKLVVTKKRKRY